LRLERKAVPAEYKTDLAKREVTGYAAIFGNVDLGGDRIVKGAFTKTLADDMPANRIKVRRNHESAIGMPIHMEQDSKGLLTVSRISQTPLGDETLTLIEDRRRGSHVDRLHGRRARRQALRPGRRPQDPRAPVAVAGRVLAPRLPPMNPEATLVGVKSLDDVCYALDRMQSAVYYLRGLASIDADTADRVRALIAISDPLSTTTDDAEDLAAVTGLITDFNTYLNSARSA
jgi:hypothetical protein